MSYLWRNRYLIPDCELLVHVVVFVLLDGYILQQFLNDGKATHYEVDLLHEEDLDSITSYHALMDPKLCH